MILWVTMAQLGAGILTSSWCPRRREVGDAFLRFLALWGGGLLAPLAFQVAGAAAWSLLAAAGLCVLHASLVTAGMGRLGAWVRYPAGAAALVGIAVGAAEHPAYGALRGDASLRLGADAWSSSLLLGTTCAAMLLGHRYLVNADMPVAPLVRLAAMIGGAAIAKAALLILTASARAWPPPTHGWAIALLLPPGLFYPLRVAIGVVAPLLLAPLVWRTARMQSTQSATGILYAALVFVLIGELSARFLQLRTPLPY